MPFLNVSDDELKLLQGSVDEKIAAVAKKLENQNFVPQSRLNEVIKERDDSKTEAASSKTKVADVEKSMADATKATADQIKKMTDDLSAVTGQFAAEKTAHEQTRTSLADTKKTADAYMEFKKTQVEEAKKILGDKWMPRFESFELAELASVVHNMTGQQIATAFVKPGQKQPGSENLSGRAKIAAGLQKAMAAK